jgi:hypothetical protein
MSFRNCKLEPRGSSRRSQDTQQRTESACTWRLNSATESGSQTQIKVCSNNRTATHAGELIQQKGKIVACGESSGSKQEPKRQGDSIQQKELRTSSGVETERGISAGAVLRERPTKKSCTRGDLSIDAWVTPQPTSRRDGAIPRTQIRWLEKQGPKSGTEMRTKKIN